MNNKTRKDAGISFADNTSVQISKGNFNSLYKQVSIKENKNQYIFKKSKKNSCSVDEYLKSNDRPLRAVDITPEVLKMLQALAKERNNKDTSKVKSQKISTTKTDYQINLEGLMGEYAFSQFSGLPIDKTFYSASDGGIDFCIDNLTIQCKYSPKPDGDLLIPHNSNIKANCIVMTCNAGNNTVDVAGWIPTKAFYRQAELKELRCKTYVLSKDKLRPAIELKYMIESYMNNGGRN